MAEYRGNLLIIVHGTSGYIFAFMPLQEQFKSALCAIQITPETPLESIHSRAAISAGQGREACWALPPSWLPCELPGDVGACSFVRGERRHASTTRHVGSFPPFFALPSQFEIDKLTVRGNQVNMATVWRVVNAMNECYRRTGARGLRMADKLTNAYNGLAVSDCSEDTYAVFEQVVAMIAKLLIELAVFHAQMQQDRIPDLLSEWYSGFRFHP